MCVQTGTWKKTYEIYVSYKPFCLDTLNEFNLLQRKSE